jgi:hypothetical protein
MGIETFEYSSTVSASSTKEARLSVKRGSFIPENSINVWLRVSGVLQTVINLKKKNSDFRIALMNDVSEYSGTDVKDQIVAVNEFDVYVPDLEGDYELEMLFINESASSVDFQVNGVIITPSEAPQMIRQGSVKEVSELPFSKVSI